MTAFAQWLGSTPFSLAIQHRTWLVALLQAVHIIMIGLVFVSMLMIALRVLGRVRADEPFDAVWERFAPWIWCSLLVMAATGALLVIGEPVRQANALSFWIKMLLIAIAVSGLLALRSSRSTLLARVLIVVWVAIIFLGRAIAYDVEVWGSWHLGA